MHALGLALDLELGEDHGRVGVPGGVADVVLARHLVGRGDHELLGRRVVGRDRAECLDVRAVSGLGHREAAHDLPGDQVGEVGVMVRLRAQLQDRSAEEPELDPDLDQHRQVTEREGLEGRDRGPDITAAAVLLGKSHPGLTGGRHLHHEVADPVTELVGRHGLAPRSTEAYSARLVRTRLRTSAYRPSSSRVSAATSTFGWTYSEASVSSAPLSWVWAVSVAMAGRYRTDCLGKTFEVGLGAPEKGHNSHLEGWFLHAGGLGTGVEVRGESSSTWTPGSPAGRCAAHG